MKQNYLKCYTEILDRLLSEEEINGNWVQECITSHGKEIFDIAKEDAIIAHKNCLKTNGFDQSVYYSLDMLIGSSSILEKEYNDIRGITLVPNSSGGYVIIDLCTDPSPGDHALVKNNNEPHQVIKYEGEPLLNIRGILIGAILE
jgi:hypothetical protein